MRLLRHAIVVTPSCRKPLFLVYRQSYPEDDITLLTLEELEQLFLYRYDDRALRYLLEKGKGYQEAKDTLKAISYIKLRKHYQHPRLVELQKLAQELVDLGYLYKDEYAKYMFKDKYIVLDGYQVGKRISYALDDVPNICMTWLPNEEDNENYPRIAEFSHIYGELHYVCNRIADDIAHGVKPEDILISGYSEEYRLPLSLMSKAYGFTVALPSSVSLYQSRLGKAFLSSLDDLDSIDEASITACLNTLRETFGSNPSFSSLVQVAFGLCCNGIAKSKQLQIYEEALKEKREAATSYEHAVGLLNEDFPLPGKRIYRIDFNLSNSPRVIGDNDFLFDEEKKELGMPVSLDYNREAKANLLAFLRSPSVVSVSYHARHLNNSKNPSSLMAAKEKDVSPTSPMLVLPKPTLDYEYSTEFAKIWKASLLDEYEQFGVLAPELHYLEDTLGKEAVYSNEFVHFDDANNLNGKLVLSASSLDTFYKCPFHYFCKYVLKIDDTESSFTASIGTIFHAVLEHYYDAGFNLETAYQNAIKEEENHRGEPFSSRERVLLENLYDYLKVDTEFLARQDELMHSPENGEKYKVEYRREFHRTIPVQTNLELTGSADKIILTENGKQKYATFVDYKSYSKVFDKRYVPYGFYLQLPLYAYMASRLKEFEEYQTLGLFIAPILPITLYGQKGKTLQELRWSGLKLNGVFVSDTEGLATLDYGWMASETILGCKYGKNGFDARNAHVVSQDELDEIIRIAEEKIVEAASRIRSGDYPISPVSVKNKENACDFCCFKDVCYLKMEQVRYLTPLDKEEGGEEDV